MAFKTVLLALSALTAVSALATPNDLAHNHRALAARVAAPVAQPVVPLANSPVRRSRRSTSKRCKPRPAPTASSTPQAAPTTSSTPPPPPETTKHVQKAKPTPSPEPAPAPAPSPEPAPEPAPASKPDPPKNSGNGGGNSDPVGDLITGGFGTFFFQNGVAGACGKVHSDNDLIVAMDVERYGDTSRHSDLCGKQVLIKNPKNGKSVTCTVADACPTCNNGNSIDMSTGAFNQIANPVDGLIKIEWKLLD